MNKNEQVNEEVLGSVSPQEGEEIEENFAGDREELREMSSFLRNFRGQSEPDQTSSGTSEEAAGTEEITTGTDEITTGTEEATTETDAETAVTAEITLPDGRKLTPAQVLEMEKGAMMQADYTRKTQALAEERRQMEQQKQEADRALQILHSIERDPIGTLQKLQEEYEAKGIYEPKDTQILELEDRKRDLDAKEQAILQRQQEIEQQVVYRDLENRMVALEQKYGKGFDRQKVIQFMIDEKIYSPEIAHNAIRAEQLEAISQKQIDDLKKQLQEAKKEAVNEYIKARTVQKPASLPIGAGSTVASPPVQVKRPKTLDDAKKAAMAREM